MSKGFAKGVDSGYGEITDIGRGMYQQRRVLFEEAEVGTETCEIWREGFQNTSTRETHTYVRGRKLPSMAFRGEPSETISSYSTGATGI